MGLGFGSANQLISFISSSGIDSKLTSPLVSSNPAILQTGLVAY